MPPFPLLLDTDRRVYRAYGLGRSVVNSWHTKMILTYLGLVLKGRKLRPIQGDPNQLGGDFIVDRHGILRFAHPSENPTDRPSVQELLQALELLKHPDAGGTFAT